MTVEAFRMQNFMGFEDSGWIELRPITLLFGRNSVGKSAILRALLLLKQSLDSPLEVGPLWFVRDDGLDFGDYTELVRDHEPKRDISFWFRCRFQQGSSPYAERALDAINDLTAPSVNAGQEAPTMSRVSIRLIYGWHATGVPMFKGMDIYDARRDIVLRAILHQDQPSDPPRWRFVSEFFDPDDQPEPNLWPFMEVINTTGFLPRIRPAHSRLVQAEESIQAEEWEHDETLGTPFLLVLMLLRGIRSSIAALLEGLNYLGPLRAEPQRYYYVPGQGSALLQRGQHMVRVLLREGLDAIPRVSDWLMTLGLRVELRLSELDARKTLYELRLADTETRLDGGPLTSNIREVGFGITQVLPIIVQAMLSPHGSTVMIEQPELHLHPRAQAELGDLFVSAAHHGVYSVLETHSEHLLLRLQTQIAKTTAGQIPTNQPDRMLLPDQVGVYFAHRKHGISTLTKIEIGAYGDLLSTPEGFEDFFSDDVLETAARMRARLTATKRGA